MLQSLTSRGFLDQVGQKRGNSYRLPRWATPLAPGATPLAPGATPLAADTLPQPSWDIDSRLLEIAKPARDKKKLVPALTRTIIRQLCEGQYLRAEQLGELMDRSKEKLQTNFLAPMVQNGELTLRYPGQLTHPEQAYRTNPDWRES